MSKWKQWNGQTVINLLEEIFHALVLTLRYGARLVQRMSAPALLGAALILAFILTILPLAVLLFAVFLLLKIAVGVCVIGTRRQRRDRGHHN